MIVLTILGFVILGAFAAFGLTAFIKGHITKYKSNKLRRDFFSGDLEVKHFVPDAEKAKKIAGITVDTPKVKKVKPKIESIADQNRKIIAAQAFAPQPVMPEVLETMKELENVNSPLTDQILNEGK